MKVIFSAGPTSKRTDCVGVAVRHGAQNHRPAATAITAITAMLGKSHLRLDDDATRTPLPLVEETAGAARSINSSVGFKSCADCQRSLGFFSRHLRTTRSSARVPAG